MSDPRLSIPRLSVHTQAESMQISDCVVPASSETRSPVHQFEIALTALATTSSGMSSHKHPTVLGEMLIVAAVASVEAYFRDVLSGLVAVCPLTLNNVQSETITIGAATSYPPEVLALALVERTLFSTKGNIEKGIKRFTKIELSGLPELRSAIEAFERACTCRHSAAHWRGYLDSATLRELGITGSTVSRFQLDPSYALVQRVFSACDHLVHVANEALYGHTVNLWVQKGLLVLDDPSDPGEIARLEGLYALFSSQNGGAEVSSGGELLEHLVASG